MMIEFIPQIRTDSWGRMTLEGLAGRGARITAETRCTRCGQAFKAGDKMLAHLEEDWNSAPVEHNGECP